VSQAPVSHECKQDQRIGKLEDRVDDVEDALEEGGKQFVSIGKDVAHLTEKVGVLTSVLAWVGGAIGLGLLGTAGAALIWVIKQGA